jgi:hypothetical protein
MRKSKNINKNIRIFVEVLQNGQVLSETSRPFHKKSTIYLTSNPAGELTAPYYPLPCDIPIINITEQGAELDLDPNWEGFTTYQGEIETISSDRKSQYTHIMKAGDFGSLTYGNLKVLIRIGKARPIRKNLIKQNNKYKSNVFDLFFGEKNDRRFLWVGLLIATWFTGLLSAGLLLRKDDRPNHIYDLKREYSLAFIDSNHLRFIPEALNQIKRPDDLVKETFSFYKAVIAKFLGFFEYDHKAIYKNTKEIFLKIHRQRESDIYGIKETQRKLEEKILAKPITGLVYIPTIVGESFDNSILRLEDKLSTYHSNLSETLALRLETTKAFRNDTPHDFEEYKSIKPKKANDEETYASKMNAITQSLANSGGSIFIEAGELADYASGLQRNLEATTEQFERLNDENSQFLELSAENENTTFLAPETGIIINAKLANIGFSQFDPKRSTKVKEPLLGEIDPTAVESLVKERQFELQLCFELALRRNRDVSGAMTWQWRLDSRGKISEIKVVESSIKDAKMIECIRKKIARWKFPRPKRGSVQINYPFRFDRRNG